MKKANFSQNKGFTLIELLVVIVILAALSVIVAVVVQPFELTKRGRDVQRLSDLAKMDTAINVASQESTLTTLQTLCTPPADTTPPCTGDSFTGSRATDGTGWIKVNFTSQKSVTVPTLPIDPSNSASSKYTYKADATGWKITAVLESQQQSGKMKTDGGTDNNSYEIGSNLSL